MNNYCKKCGKLLNQGEIICTNCGTSNSPADSVNVNNFNTVNQVGSANSTNNNLNQTNNNLDTFGAFNQNFNSMTTNNQNNSNNFQNTNLSQNLINNTNNGNNLNTQNIINPSFSNDVNNDLGNNNLMANNINNNQDMNNLNGLNSQSLSSTNNSNQNFNYTNNDYNNQSFNSHDKSSFINKISNFITNNKKIVLVIFGIVIAIIVIGLSVFLYTSLTSKKMVCKSSYGDFTLKYKGSKITGYSASGTFGEQIDFDINEQNDYVKESGIDNYLNTFSEAFISATGGTCTIDGKKVEEKTDTNDEDVEIWDEKNDSKVIGNSDYGYVKVPNDWVEFHDVNGNDMVQYSYAGVFIVSLYAYDGSKYSAKQYASAFESGMEEDENVFSVSLAGYTENLNGTYDAYKVTADYNDGTYLYTYWFEAEDGKVHYIAIEGPEEVDGKSFFDIIKIADTFTLTK